MSTFTNWNGPQESGPSKDMWQELITQYKALLGESNTYVKREAGKGLSECDFTNALKSKLEGIGSAATKNVGAIASGSTDLVTGGAVFEAIKNFITSSALNGYLTKSVADNSYAAKNSIPSLTGYMTSTDFATAMLDYATESKMKDWVNTQKFIKGTDSSISWDSLIAGYKQHTKSHGTDADDNLTVTNNIILENDNAVQAHVNNRTYNMLKMKAVPSGNDVTGVYDCALLMIGDETNSAIPTSTQRMAFLDQQNKLHFYPLQEELGTVPVGGMIDWPKSGTTFEELGLDPSGEWQPCNGAVIPSGSEYDTVRSICGSHFPDKPGKIIHAKASSMSEAAKSNIYAMDVATLSAELQRRLEQADAIVAKYEAMIAAQNQAIADETNRAAKSVQSVNKRLTDTHAQLREAIDMRATNSALETEIKQRSLSDEQLRQHIINEHIAAHEAEQKLDEKIDDNTRLAKSIAQQSVITLTGTVNDLPTETPTANGIVIQDSQKLLLNDSGTLSIYIASVDDYNQVTWRPA